MTPIVKREGMTFKQWLDAYQKDSITYAAITVRELLSIKIDNLMSDREWRSSEEIYNALRIAGVGVHFVRVVSTMVLIKKAWGYESARFKGYRKP